MTTTSPLQERGLLPELIEVGDGDRSGVALVGTACTACGQTFLGDKRQCAACGSGRVEGRVLPRTGRVASSTVVHRAPGWWPGQVPYVLAEVKLDALDLYVTSEVVGTGVVGTGAEAPPAGAPVELTAEEHEWGPEGRRVVVYKWALTEVTG